MTNQSQPTIFVAQDLDILSKSLCEWIRKLAMDSIASPRGRFTIALSGGSLPKTLSRSLLTMTDMNWSQWFVFLADERCVPLTHSDSNGKLIQETLLNHLPIPSSQFFHLPSNLTFDSKTPPENISDRMSQLSLSYELKLKSVFSNSLTTTTQSLPEFDLILLGMGPDGHTCSLFPGHSSLFDNSWITSLVDSPKLPPYRISFTLSLINNAKNVCFVVTGEGKSNTLVKILDDKDSTLPCVLGKSEKND